ncbi:permease [Psychromonas sp. Urea-02u-13]|uniref:permease n=1 Tax=Psychromonas sp. Urea-02u-13 TaxID=2058326 RepID=UPI000C31C000|nr:permease [Psychromonas sp. Urea-02u-13]PKG40118.1 permease [Psychromonas sp. Urea-02u-13]
MLLFLSVLALFLGPITYRLFQRQPGWLDFLDAFIFVTISGLVLFHILPELLHSGGLIVLLLMAIGLLIPSWIEKYFHKVANQAHQTTLFLGVLGLVLHATIDGSALLVETGDHTAWLLALGVLLHRFPVGLTVWWLLRPQYGRTLPLVILACMSLATIGGALFADYSFAQLDGELVTWFQAFVMGSIMHVVLHRPYLNKKKHSHSHDEAEKEEQAENRYAAGAGSILGLIVLAAVLLPHWLGYIEHNHDHEATHETHSIVAINHEEAGHEGHDHEVVGHEAHEEAGHEGHDHDAVGHEAHEEAGHEGHDHDAVGHEAHEEAGHEGHDHDAVGHEDHEEAGHEGHDHDAVEHKETGHEGHDHDDAEHEAHEEAGHEGHDHQSHTEVAEDEHRSNTALTLINVTKIALYSAPMLLFAYFLSALMHYFKPKFSIMPMQGSQNFFADSLKGVTYGLPLPVCSPSASKMHQQLLQLGANQTFATAFLIATPIIGFDALLISLPLLGEQMLLLRLSLAAIFALSIAWLLGRHFKTPISLIAAHSCQGGKPTSRFISAIKQGYQHQLDHTAPWVLLGWALAATLSTSPAWSFFEQALWLQVLVMIVIAFPFALCATGITPVLAVLLMAGLSPGAAIAFFLIAPTISLELLKTLSKQQGFFAAMSLAMLMTAGAFLTGLLLNQYINVLSPAWLEQNITDYGLWQMISLAVILVLYFSSLLRRGARCFIAELVPKSFLKHSHSH